MTRTKKKLKAPRPPEDRLDRAASIRIFELTAETIFINQLDLLAQLEAQLRSAHHTLRATDKLRSAKHRVGPELKNGDRRDTLVVLAEEIRAIDAELQAQHQSCVEILGCIREMQARLTALRPMTPERER